MHIWAHSSGKSTVFCFAPCLGLISECTRWDKVTFHRASSREAVAVLKASESKCQLSRFLSSALCLRGTGCPLRRQCCQCSAATSAVPVGPAGQVQPHSPFVLNASSTWRTRCGTRNGGAVSPEDGTEGSDFAGEQSRALGMVLRALWCPVVTPGLVLTPMSPVCP